MDKDKKEVFETLNHTLDKLLSHKQEIDVKQVDIVSHFEIEMITKKTETLVDQIQKLQTAIYQKQLPSLSDPVRRKGRRIRPHRLKRKYK